MKTKNLINKLISIDSQAKKIVHFVVFGLVVIVVVVVVIVAALLLLLLMLIQKTLL